MDAMTSLITVVVAGLLLSASPGPSMAYVLSRSVQYGHSGGLASSLGLAVGGMLHALFAALGLSLIAVQFPWLMQLIKYAGAIYLCYLAYGAFKEALPTRAAEEAEHCAVCLEHAEHATPGGQETLAPVMSLATTSSEQALYRRLFINGVLIELSNPKTILFFLSFMPQFVQHFSMMGMFLLSSLIPITAIPADLIAIFAGGMIARRVRSNSWLMQAVNGAVGLLLLGIAALVLWA